MKRSMTVDRWLVWLVGFGSLGVIVAGSWGGFVGMVTASALAVWCRIK